MNIFALCIVFLWLAFWTYWIVSAFSAKKYVRNKEARRSAAFRILLTVVIVLVLNVPGVERFLDAHGAAFMNPAVRGFGVVLCAAGIAFAVWARRYLGRNWGTPMSLKENAELITSGPYRLVRHPIYFGMIIALFGTALVLGGLWLLIFFICGSYFAFIAARVEERLMTEQFPDQYPAYKKKTKTLIPFVW
jgi:protein-S-isoprenylcysteine O-methyltransferase Ste14